LEQFDGSEALKDHQRAKVPCELKQASVDTITDEQEKKLHTRAKPNVPEEEKWREMYQIIFPGEEVPSPCTCRAPLTPDGEDVLTVTRPRPGW
jgi:hypothetical protein